MIMILFHWFFHSLACCWSFSAVCCFLLLFFLVTRIGFDSH